MSCGAGPRSGRIGNSKFARSKYRISALALRNSLNLVKTSRIRSCISSLLRDNQGEKPHCLIEECSRAAWALPHQNAPDTAPLCQAALPAAASDGWIALKVALAVAGRPLRSPRVVDLRIPIKLVTAEFAADAALLAGPAMPPDTVPAASVATTQQTARRHAGAGPH